MKLARKLSKNLLVMQGQQSSGQVTQEDLMELMLLAREAKEAHQKYLEKKQAIMAALRAGAAVEDGVLVGRIVRRAGKARNYETLEMR